MNENDLRNALRNSSSDVSPSRDRLHAAQRTAMKRRGRRDAATAAVGGGLFSLLAVFTFVNLDNSGGGTGTTRENVNLAAQVEATAEVPVSAEQSASRPKVIVGAAKSGRLVTIDPVTGKTTSLLGVFKDATDQGKLPGNLSLTPDNKTVYFDVLSGNCDPDIMKVAVAGGDVERVTSGTAPSVSPDGATLAYVRHRDCFRTEIVRRNIATGAEDVIGTTTAKKVGSIAWSPSGTTLAIDLRYDDARNNRIVLVSSVSKTGLDDSAVLALPSNAPAGTVYEWPSYLPDGRLFVSERCCTTDTGIRQSSSRLLIVDPADASKIQVVAIGVASKDHTSNASDESGAHLLYLSGEDLMVSDDGKRPSPISFGLVGATWH